MSTPNPSTPASTEPARAPKSRMWVLFLALILLQLAAWTAWLVIASKHKVAEVPLAPQAHR